VITASLRFFETMGIPILQGCSFQSTDAVSRGMVAIVNETLADTFWRGRNPIGQRLRPLQQRQRQSVIHGDQCCQGRQTEWR
jgi:hypothetical protein